ncbi:leucine-rich repeat domain-containing protein [Mucilaginibacter antarcticus]|uniref:Leucine-rich repeat domain-containing protein n=2 Tax=Mucilaginibacter antarcticus TaxID=1855725 RepID=A0ABW5XTG6_9SPHI
MEEALKDPEEVKEISFYFDDITVLPESVLRLTSLEAITIDRCPKLNLKQAIGVLSKLPHLQSFAYNHNDLANLPADISNLKDITELALVDNKLVTLPASILKLEHLQKLNLSENLSLDFVQTFDLLSKAGSLRQLVLEQNKLSDLSINLTKMVQLDDLLLGNNHFTDVPEQVKGMPLKYLDLSSNMLELLNIRKGDLAQLTGINLDQNEIRELPPELLLLPNLRKVSLLGNLIATIPKWIKSVKGLQEMDLSSNVLTELPAELSQLPNLRELILSGNHLTAGGLEPLFDMPWLTRLELHRNDISYIDPKVENLANLKELDIGNNPLVKLPVEFSQLKNLVTLSAGILPRLAWNDTFAILAQLPRLSKLSAFYNGFGKIPDGLLKLGQVHYFVINGNGFDKDEKDKLTNTFPNAEIVF